MVLGNAVRHGRSLVFTQTCVNNASEYEAPDSRFLNTV